MSQFLFILAMEGLHVVLCKAIQVHLYKGFEVGVDSVPVSHLMYVDDVIFMGELSLQNVNHLIGMLRCFYV